jgi:hypothetical protein
MPLTGVNGPLLGSYHGYVMHGNRFCAQKVYTNVSAWIALGLKSLGHVVRPLLGGC